MKASIENARLRQEYTESILESALEAIVTLDADSIVTGWSKGAGKLFGYTSKEAMGKNIDILLAGEDLVIHKEAVGLSHHVSSNLPVGPIETIRYHKDGTAVNVILSGSPVLVSENFEGSVASYTDITERVRAEKAMQESEQRYRSFVQNFQGIAYRGSFDFTPTFFHGAVEEITGYTEDEFIAGTPRWDQVIHPDDLSSIFNEDEKKLHSVPNYSYEREYRIVCKGGEIRWVHEVIQNICDDKGKPVMVQGAIYDITGRKQTEKSLRDSESRFRSLIEQSPISTILYTTDGQPTYGNPASAKLWNMTPELGQHVYQTYNIFDDKQLADQGAMPDIQKGFAGEFSQTKPIRYDPRQTDPNYVGPPRWLQAFIYPVKDEGGSISEVVVMHVDITKRKQAEEVLEESEERLITVLDSIDTDVYVSEMETYEILFLNQHMRDSFDGNMIGQICWQVFRGETGPCPHCTNDQLLDADGNPAGVVVWEGRNPITGKWYINYDRAIKWVDNRFVRLQVATDITETKLAEEEIRRYADRTEALLEIEEAISSTLDLAEVLHIIMKELKKAISYDSISMQTLQRNSLEILACRGFDQPDEVVGLAFPLDPKFPNHHVIETKEPLAIEDVTQEYPHFQKQSTKYTSGHIRSWLGVPLISKGRVKGMIAVDRSEVVPFSEAEIKTAAAIASQAALAIENASLYSEAQRRLDRLSSLRRIDEAITSSMDLRVTMNVLLTHVIQQLEVDATAVLLYRQKLQSLEFVAGQGFRTKALQFTNLRLGEGFAGRAALERRTVQLSDLSQLEAGFLRSPDFRTEEFVAYIGVPLIAKGNIIGVLEIYHRQPLEPDPEWMAFLKTLAGQAAIAIDNINLLQDLQMSNIHLIQAYDATIEGWAHALEIRDMETEGHSRRVVDMTLQLARKLNTRKEEMVHIRRGAQLHDIGKMGVPDAILQKPDKLNEEEWQIMRKHPVFAFEWLSTINYLRPALDIPYCHHEKWDGTGYPRGLKGDGIPLAARIFAVVDVWDALLSERPYRKAWTEDEVFEYIRTERGIHFDPRVVDAFLSTMSRR